MASLGTVYATAPIPTPGADLSDHSGFIDMARFPAQWWAAVSSSGNDIRAAVKYVSNPERFRIPIDVIEFDKNAQTGFAAIKTDALIGDAGHVFIFAGGEEIAVPASDTFGRHNAYDSNWVGFWPSGGGNDRTANANDLTMFGATAGDSAGNLGNKATDYGGTTNFYGRATASVPSAFPLTLIVAGRRTDATSAERGALGLHSNGSPTNNQFLTPGVAVGPVAETNHTTSAGGGSDSAVSDGSGATPYQWVHHATVVGAADSRSAFVNGGGKQTDADSRTPASLDEIIVAKGSRSGLSSNSYQGLLGLAQVHDVARPDEWISYQAAMMFQAAFWGAWKTSHSYYPSEAGNSGGSWITSGGSSGGSFLTSGGGVANPRTPAQLRGVASAVNARGVLVYGLAEGDIPAAIIDSASMTPRLGQVLLTYNAGDKIPSSAVTVRNVLDQAFLDGTGMVLERRGERFTVINGRSGAFLWRGAWDNGTAYDVDDVVENDGSSYIAVAAHTGSEPPSANWELVASIGGTGPQGDPGQDGADALAVTAVQTSNYNAAAGDLVPCDTSSGSFAITLPTDSDPDTLVGVTLTAHGAATALTITASGTGAGIIGGKVSVVSSVSAQLFLTGDTLVLRHIGSNDWIIERENVTAHSCELTSASSSPQSIPNNTLTQVELDIAVSDVGGLADLANDRAVIRRAGRYVVTVGTGVFGDSALALFRVAAQVNGSAEFTQTLNQPTPGNNVQQLVSKTVEVAAGDLLTVHVQFNGGGPWPLLTGAADRSRIVVTEVR